MWLAENWREYELLDCGGGERLERWGDRVLVRPDPQVIWDTPRRNPLWKRPDGHYRRSRTGGGHWEYASENREYADRTEERRRTDNERQRKDQERQQKDRDTESGLLKGWPLRYGELTFQVKPMNFKHTGLFPEQAANWDFVMEKIRSAKRLSDGKGGNRALIQDENGPPMRDGNRPPIRVLNLFAYTGGATIACAKAGASVCHVDAAKGMVAWAKENARLSGLQNAPIRWIVDDCAKFVEREIRRGNRYDALIMDPPSYGRGPGGEVWKLEDSLYDFMKLCAGVLSENPLFVLISSYTTGLAPSVLGYLLRLLIETKYGGKSVWDELGLPVTETGFALPCGAAGRWETMHASLEK